MAYGSGSAPASRGGTFRPSMGHGAGCTTCSAGGSGTAPGIGFTALQARTDAKELITWDIYVDSTVCRAHQHAAGARKKGSCRRSRPAASLSSRTTTGSGARAAA